MMSKKEMKELLEKHEKAMIALQNALASIKQSNECLKNQVGPKIERQKEGMKKLQDNLRAMNDRLKKFLETTPDANDFEIIKE